MAAGSTTTIYAAPAAGGAPVTIEMGQTSDSKWALKGSTILYLGSGKIRTVDLKTPTMPKDIVSTGTLYGTFFVTSAKDKVVYTVGTGPTDKTAITFVATIQ
jgi:hypothetical protein